MTPRKAEIQTYSKTVAGVETYGTYAATSEYLKLKRGLEFKFYDGTRRSKPNGLKVLKGTEKTSLLTKVRSLAVLHEEDLTQDITLPPRGGSRTTPC